MARAMAYFMCFVLFHHITGAHFNPATTFAVYIKDKMAGKFKTESDQTNAKVWLGYTMFAQMIGSFAGLIVTYFLAKYHASSYILYPIKDNFGLYHYDDVISGEESFQYIRIFAQEMIWTFVFTLVFLTLTAEKSYFSKSNVILKGIGLGYTLMVCYLFSIGAGQCLNPALGLSQSTYMVAYDYQMRLNPNRDTVRHYCMLIYIFAPFVGALIAAYAYHHHAENVRQQEEEEADRHKKKLDSSRSVDQIDVDDTRSTQSDCLTE